MARRLRLLLRPWERVACAALNVAPLPGLGAVLAGWRNAHTTLRRNGALQLALVALGSWPLVVPCAAGFLWAAWDTIRIAHAALAPLPPRAAAPGAPSPKAARR